MAAAVAASIAAGALAPVFHLLPESSAAVAGPAHHATTNAPLAFADIVERVQPAVVNISTTTSVPEAAMSFLVPPGHPMEPFFYRFFGTPPSDAPELERQGAASGFIIDPSGYVVTNHHVVEGAKEITVTLNDGSHYPAKIVGSDTKTDLALLEVDAPKPLPYVAFGDSDALRAGDWVLAIGNPFGLGGTVTAGIVSARGRDIHAGPYDDFLQIDAPINRGNSGGPLFDTTGQVVGVNTAIFSPTGGSVGIGFAVPASLARSIVAELRHHGRIDRGWLGVQIQSVTPEVAESLGLAQTKGALVASVVAGSPAARAGLVPSDIVLAVDGAPIDDARDLARRIGNLNPGAETTVEVWHADERITRTLRLEGMPADDALAAADQGGATANAVRLGMELASLGPELRERFGIGPETTGTVVVAVAPGSPAAQSGIRPGDVIAMVNRDKVTDPSAVLKGVESARAAKRNAVLLLVDRHGEEHFLTVPLT